MERDQRVRATVLVLMMVLAATPAALAQPSATVAGFVTGWPCLVEGGGDAPMECRAGDVRAWQGGEAVAHAHLEQAGDGGAVYRVALPSASTGLVTFTVDGASAREYVLPVAGGTYLVNLTPAPPSAAPPSSVEVSTTLPNATVQEVLRVLTTEGEVVATAAASPDGRVHVSVPAWPGQVRLLRLATEEVVNLTLDAPWVNVTWPGTDMDEGEQVTSKEESGRSIPSSGWMFLVAWMSALAVRRKP